MPTPFRIKQLDATRWVPNHPNLENTTFYSNGDGPEIPFAAIRESLFSAVSNQNPDVYTLGDSTENHREHLFSKIDTRTREKIAEGFVFDGVVYSLSTNAQTNYSYMLSGADLLTYPIVVNTLDDSDTLSLPDEEAVTRFCSAALSAVRAIIDVGTELKNDVRLANSAEELDAITLDD